MTRSRRYDSSAPRRRSPGHDALIKMTGCAHSLGAFRDESVAGRSRRSIANVVRLLIHRGTVRQAMAGPVLRMSLSLPAMDLRRRLHQACIGNRQGPGRPHERADTHDRAGDDPGTSGPSARHGPDRGHVDGILIGLDSWPSPPHCHAPPENSGGVTKYFVKPPM